jgi:hypothetical protein
MRPIVSRVIGIQKSRAWRIDQGAKNYARFIRKLIGMLGVRAELLPRNDKTVKVRISPTYQNLQNVM